MRTCPLASRGTRDTVSYHPASCLQYFYSPPWLLTVGPGKPFIGSLPPTKDGELKWWGAKIFANTREILPGRHVSAPPPAKDYSQWKVSRRLKQDIAEQRDLWYGRKSAKWKMTKHRICW